MSEEEQKIPTAATAWNLAQNPIFRRYCKSQLRPVSTTIWAITVLVFATFSFLAIYVGSTNLGRQEEFQAARWAMMAVLGIQGLLLMLIGTGATTLAYVREADEKMVDYQRLTPMTPIAKVLGYLFGPPIRSYLLFLITVPFAIFCIVVGKISFEPVFQVYVTFFVSAILYHLTGLLAGTILKRRLLAGILSMGLVFCINFVLPAILARSGYTFLFYTTVWPVLFLHGSGLSLETGGSKELLARHESFQAVDFFQFEIPTFVFGLCVQGFLIFTFALILYRRWKGESLHLLSKSFTLFVFCGILILFLGTSLPLMDSGRIFPSMSTQFGQRYMGPTGMQATFAEALGITAACGIITLIIACMLIQIITPTRDGFIRGLRRAHKAGRQRARFGSDSSTGLWHAVFIGLLGGLAWFWFTDVLFSTDFYPNLSLPNYAVAVMCAIFIFATVCFGTTLELFGKGVLWLAMLLVWIVPLLAAGILFLAEKSIGGIYLTSLSAYGAYFNSLTTLLAEADYKNYDHMKHAFWIWVFSHALLVVVLITISRMRQSRLRLLVEAEGISEG